MSGSWVEPVAGDNTLGRAVALARNWWALGLRGVFAILLGIVALAWPGITLGSLVLVFAVYMLVDGVFALVAGLRAASQHGNWAGMVLEGVIDLVVGAIALMAPLLTLLAFVWLAGGWAVVSGAAMIWAAFRLHPAHGRWLLLLGGAVSVIWGLLLFVAPVAGAVVMTWWLGAYALLFGITMLVAAFRLRRLHTGHAV